MEAQGEGRGKRERDEGRGRGIEQRHGGKGTRMEQKEGEWKMQYFIK